MSIRERAKQFFRRFKYSPPNSPRSGTPEPCSPAQVDCPEPYSTLMLAASASVLRSRTIHPIASRSALAATASTATIAAPPFPLEGTQSAPTRMGPTKATHGPVPSSGSALSESRINPPRTKHAAWTGLKAFTKLLSDIANEFGPLKSAVGGILECIDIFESAAKGRQDYEALRVELNELFKNLSIYFGGFTPPVMTSSIESLAKGIKKELALVRQKQDRSTLGRLAGAKGDADEVLECYRRIQGLLARLALNANLSMWTIVDEQSTEYRLEKLSHDPAAWHSSAESARLRNGCTPNTRISVLNQLHDWASNSESEKIYWLNGMAGTGKTTIAISTCEQLDTTRKLAASFFCSRQQPACRDVKLIFPNLSYQLARFSRPFRSALSRALEQDPEVYTKPLAVQFEKLVAGPLQEVMRTMPADLVVVIDALDECDDANGVGRILDILLTHTSHLSVKFLVTSRPEPKIVHHMLSRKGERSRFEIHLHNLEHSVVQEDIRTYLKVQLHPIDISDEQLERLVEKAGVLFIYASTVARYIGCDKFRARKRLAAMLGVSALSSNSHAYIDALYSAILLAAIDGASLEDSEKEEMKLVLNTVLCALEPLSVSALAGMLKLDSDDSVHAALRPLLSVLHVSEETGLVTTLHASFPDFVFDQRRSQIFHCDTNQHNAQLARLCFDMIKTPDPPFNICRLESSCVFDKDVPHLAQKVNKAISTALFYACLYWGDHLKRSESSQILLDDLYEFLSTRLLIWMEIMNLKRCINTGSRVLSQIQAWCQSAKCSDEIQQLARDASAFVTACSSSPISLSTPHIYISGLPFWPEQRPVFKFYSRKMHGPIRASGTAMHRRALAPLATWDAHGEIYALAISPNGTHIVSGSGEKTLSIWDAHSGRILGEPLRGHTGVVLSVAYSPDGRHIVSGSDDHIIRIWDALSGRIVGEPLRGHTGSICSVAYSPDDTRIVSGSGDKTIRIWDAHTGGIIGEPLRGHTDWVRTVAYSPDGAHIVSGSDDNTIRIWDARGGQTIGEPLPGHTDWVWSVTYSPDGAHIVSGSRDNTIRIWDVESGKIICEPLRGHTAPVSSVAYSPDGRHVVSGSQDRTICVWDARSGKLVGEPLQGHTRAVRSVAYSPDSARIISGSEDNSIRIWEAHRGHISSSSPQGHTDAVRSVVYSPDGTHIASCSDDSTICIWDAHSGKLVGEPLQGHTSWVLSVAYSPSGRHIVSGSGDETIRIWDADSGEIVGEPLRGHTDPIYSVAYSPDGARIVSGSSDETIRIWDAQSGEIIGEPLRGHNALIWSVAYSPSGAHIVSGSGDDTIRIWDAHNGQIVGEPLRGHEGTVRAVAYSPDGARIASGSDDNTIRIWDADSGTIIGEPLSGHTAVVLSVAYSPNGAHIVSGASDKTVCIWDAHSGQMVGGPLQGHTGDIFSVSYSPDGAHIVSGSYDHCIRIWDALGCVNQKARKLLGTRARDVQPAQLRSSGYPEASTPEDLSATWLVNEDGWVVTDDSSLLIWVPPDLRAGLLRTQNTAIISKGGSVKLDFCGASIGEAWHECY